jgi:hypothetical protein
VIHQGIDGEMRSQPYPAQPLVEKERKASGLVAIEKYCISPASARASLVNTLAEELHCFLPGDVDEPSITTNTRAVVAVGIVQPLEGSLPASAQRAAVQRVLRISLELDRATVAGFGDDAACGRALATGRREIRRDAGDGLVGTDQIGNEPSRLARTAARGSRPGARDAEDLQELAAPNARGLCRVAHRLSSDTRCSRSGPVASHDNPRTTPC